MAFVAHHFEAGAIPPGAGGHDAPTQTDALADVVGLDLSFDAKQITFAMRRGGDWNTGSMTGRCMPCCLLSPGSMR